MRLGHFNDMVAYRQTENGWYLIDSTAEEVLLPNKFIPEGMEKGDEIEVFVYLDNEERNTATTQKPKLNLGEFGMLEVMDLNRVGAFVDWGLDKQLLVPYSDQVQDMEVGESYVIHLKMDTKTNRMIGSNKVKKHLNNDVLTVDEGDEVDLIAYKQTDLGVNVIINNEHDGLIFNNQIFKKINYGDQLKGYIHKIREGNKLDVVLEKQGYLNVIEPTSKKILEYLKDNGGYTPFNDKSDPEDIRITFGMSKKNFKKAIGALYRQKLVRLESDGTYLV